MASEEKLLLTPDEVCAQIGVGRANLFKMLARGEIDSFKVGRLRRIPFAGLKAWVERQAPRQDRSAPQEDTCVDHEDLKARR